MKLKRRRLERRTQAVRMDMGLCWFRDEIDNFLDRLMHIAGDDLTAPDFRTMVRLYNRELIGRRKAARMEASNESR